MSGFAFPAIRPINGFFLLPLPQLQKRLGQFILDQFAVVVQVQAVEDKLKLQGSLETCDLVIGVAVELGDQVDGVFAGEIPGVERQERVGLGGVDGDGDGEIADHHFFPGLLAPVDVGARVGVVQVFFGVVEVGNAVDAGALGEDLFVGQDVGGLPVEIVTGYVEEHFFFAVGVDGLVAEGFAAQVHVGHEAHELDFAEGAGGFFDLAVVVAGGQAQELVRGAAGDDFVGDGFGIDEVEGDDALVLGLGADGGVVDLEDQVMTGGDAFGHARGEWLEAAAGDVADEEAVAAAAHGPDRVFHIVSGGGENEDVVNDGAVAGADLCAVEPFVFLEAGVHREIFVGNAAARGHGDRLWGDGEDGVGFAGQLPAGEELFGRGQIFGIAFGRAAFDPLVNLIFLLVAQAAVVGEVADFRVGVPGRHALLADDLGDGVGPAVGVVVVVQRERGDFTFAVAFDAVVLQDAGDVFGVGDLAIVPGRADAADETTGGLGDGLAYFPAGEKFIEGDFEVVAFWFALPVVDAVLVVDAAPVADGAGLVEDEDFGSPHGSHLVGDLVAEILEDGEVDLVQAGVGGDFGDVVLDIGVDGEEGDALRFVYFRQFRQARAIEFGERAFGAEEGDDQELFILEIGEGMGLATVVLQGEVFDLAAQGRFVAGESNALREGQEDQQDSEAGELGHWLSTSCKGWRQERQTTQSSTRLKRSWCQETEVFGTKTVSGMLWVKKVVANRENQFTTTLVETGRANQTG
jgi:hypothetical protein